VVDAHRAAEAAARVSYGRLIAFLAAPSRDVAAAEDALGDALRAALETWPRTGVPENPEAWLLTAARRRLVDKVRHERVQDCAGQSLKLVTEGSEGLDDRLPDKRLQLLFVCAHPAIDSSMRTPLMLQTVLGIDAARIASAFLVSAGTMGQRLVRAKAKIRDAGIAFEIPEAADLPARVEAVLEAIYACYGVGWETTAGADARGQDLVDEAIWLARLVVDLLPDEPEAKGLLALMLHCEARRPARRNDGRFVPLSEQDTRLWSGPMMAEAERLLAAAARMRRIGRFQLEGAIQSAHAERARSGSVDWDAIEHLYAGLATFAPSVGALLGRAAAIAETRGAETALHLIDEISPARVTAHQPYWALRADLLRRLGRTAEAREAYGRAMGLTEDPAVRRFLLAQLTPRGQVTPQEKAL
jgi:RNA polymerase sigma-70 factor (ECF subfamily)